MTPGRYLPLLAELDRWQAQAASDHPGVIPCRAGCTACCHGPFDISIADVAALIDAVANLPQSTRHEILARASAQAAAVRALEPEWTAPYDIRTIGDERFDRLSDALAALPCPLLDDAERCLVYHARPAVCRLMGLGLVNERQDVIDNSCPIQEDFPSYRALEPQYFALDAWEDAEESCRRAAAVQLAADSAAAEYETTVAMALLAWPIRPAAT